MGRIQKEYEANLRVYLNTFLNASVLAIWLILKTQNLFSNYFSLI
jgi:hypothetical protein